MAQYKFKVADSSHKISEITLEGEDLTEVLEKLRSRNLMPIKCLGELSAASRRKRFRGKKNRFDLCDFTQRLYPLLRAHVPLERALKMMTEGNQNAQELEVLNDLRVGLRQGKKFSVVIREQGDLFPVLYSNLLEAGEETGNLSGVMKELLAFLTSRRELREFLVTSAIYPVMVLSVTVGVLFLMFLFFIPYFADMLLDMGRELPLPLAVLRKISTFLQMTWYLWVLLGCGLFAGWKVCRRIPEFRLKLDQLFLKIPLAGELIQEADRGLFFRTLAILMENHVHLLTTMRIACNVLQNRMIANSFYSVTTDLRSGMRLSSAIGKSPYAGSMAVQMLQVGEESGDVGPMLNEIAELQENQLRVKIKRLLSLFEPVVIIVLAVTILIVVLAVFMAIMEMNEV